MFSAGAACCVASIVLLGCSPEAAKAPAAGSVAFLRGAWRIDISSEDPDFTQDLARKLRSALEARLGAVGLSVPGGGAPDRVLTVNLTKVAIAEEADYVTIGSPTTRDVLDAKETVKVKTADGFSAVQTFTVGAKSPHSYFNNEASLNDTISLLARRSVSALHRGQ
ncbi:hypothetical protein [Acetobacter nitrogenifigens]|uniref:DUF4410 domain-containing protein n=1 Tax=Acetobacter nitrogenifigens DSM 23921 = NBRC 105050 TaxID=1120919 RepID=A0A511X6Q4_9PROT|nr:hypothetical protein [Acetobacter nitrogenifigens]GEN58620.1 hypothetical protein ANI02nite_05040 [Acetobacter nitrogenifigens DSM 23921 = NBRC 105050]